MKSPLTRSDRINRMIEQLDNELADYDGDMAPHWNRPVNETKRHFWQQDKSPYLFVLGCLLILLAIVPFPSHAANPYASLSVGQALDEMATASKTTDLPTSTLIINVSKSVDTITQSGDYTNK